MSSEELMPGIGDYSYDLNEFLLLTERQKDTVDGYIDEKMEEIEEYLGRIDLQDPDVETGLYREELRKQFYSSLIRGLSDGVGGEFLEDVKRAEGLTS